MYNLQTSLVLLLSVSNTVAWTPQQPRSQGLISTPKTSASTSRSAISIPLDTDTRQKILTNQDFSGVALEPEDRWVANLDYEGFGREVTELGKLLQNESGQDDVDHLNKVVLWRNAAAAIGVLSMWMTPNPITILALSTWTYSSWAMIGHHTCHGGYNRVEAGKYNSRGFALGTVAKRASDWLDWMLPEAWNVEHNRLHHYRLNEVSDPDLVQRNLVRLRDATFVPMFFKYIAVSFIAASWKWFYYAPNTYKELQINKFKIEGKPLPEGFDPTDAVVVTSLLMPTKEGSALRKLVNPIDYFLKVPGPFFLFRYVLLPAPLLAVPGVGPALFTNAIISLMAAELLTNLHAFVTIVTNHAGEDLYTFDDAVKPKSPSFYVRQIVGSGNYDYGDDVTDFAHGYLNYQIEHHVWPDLSMLQYQRGAPLLRAICDKYGVPYVKESVFERLRKTVDIMVGKASMRTFPTQYEPAADKAGAKGISWKSNHGAIDDE